MTEEESEKIRISEDGIVEKIVYEHGEYQLTDPFAILVDKEGLENLEEELDKANSKYGSKEALCVFCGSIEFNHREGIVHKEDCLIEELREKIEKLQRTGGE